MHRRITTYGLVTVACAALTTACGEADNSRRLMLGQGGMDGSGNGGSGGNNTGMGGTSATGNGGSGGNNAGGPVTCSGGCVEMIVPFAANPASRQAQFLFRPGGTTVVDMTNTVITWKVRAGTPDNAIPPEQMFVQVFMQNGAPDYPGCYGAQVALTAANGFTDNMAWVDVVNNVRDAVLPPPPAASPLPDAGGNSGDAGGDAAPPDPTPTPGGSPTTQPPNCTNAAFDKATVFQWGLIVGVTGAFTGPGTVRVGLDSVTYEGTDTMDVTFTGGVELFQADGYMLPPGAMVVHRP